MSNEWKDKLSENTRLNLYSEKSCVNCSPYILNIKRELKKNGIRFNYIWVLSKKNLTRFNRIRNILFRLTKQQTRLFPTTSSETVSSDDGIVEMKSAEQFVDRHNKTIPDGLYALIDGMFYFSERKTSHLPLGIPRDIDFTTDLSVSQRKDAFLTIIDKFTKVICLIPCTKDTNAKGTAKLDLKYSYSIFGLSSKAGTPGLRHATRLAWCLYWESNQDVITTFHSSTDYHTQKSN